MTDSKKLPLKNVLLFLGLFLLISLSSWWLGEKLSHYVFGLKQQKDLKIALNLLGEWFVKNQTEKGDFVYELAVDSGKPKSSYNLVRQAGALYSLAQFYKYSHRPQIKMALEKGFSFFESLLESPAKTVAAAAIVEKNAKQANASALFLLALTEFMEAEPDAKNKYLPLAKQLANFLVTTQKENGGFANWPDKNQEELDYNNGETFYALARIYRFDPQPIYLDTVRKAATYFLNRYSPDSLNTQFYSWGMAGFAYLYQIDPQETYWQYLKKYTDNFMESNLSKELIRQNHSPLRGGWAVFLEGVAHVAWIAEDKDPLYFTQLNSFYQQALKNLLTLQVDGPFSNLTSDLPNVKGGICSDSICQTQRIDIIHHNLSAIYLYLSFINRGPSFR